MSDLVFETPAAKPLVIKVRRGGEEETHTFEVLPLVRSRYEAALKSQRDAQQAQEEGGDVAPILAELCDQLIRSTNGPVTITDMWRDELLPLSMLARISEAVIKEAGGANPPA